MTAVNLPFRDRRHAGRVLATQLEQYRGRAGLLVLALPRGGVAVGFEVARELRAPLDIFVVRKLGLPGHVEYAMGAIATGGVRVMNPLPGITVKPEAIAAVVEREQAELVRREQFYRKQRPAAALRQQADAVICAATPEPFHSVGLWYQKFPQTTDDEVCALLEQARLEHAIAARLCSP